jgi:hypothetical protein
LRQLFVIALALAAAANSASGQSHTRPFTVADSIEFTRALQDFGPSPVVTSPDQERYVVFLQRGDIQRNGSWITILSGNLRTFNDARRVDIVAKLFTRSKAQTQDLVKDIEWSDDSREVRFVWDSGMRPPQVVSVDVHTHKLTNVTRHSTAVVKYAIGKEGTVVYLARKQHDLSRISAMNKSGFVVGGQIPYSLMLGNLDGWYDRRHNEFFVLRAAKSARRIDMGADYDREWLSPGVVRIHISPDTRYAVALRPARIIPQNWHRYTHPIFKDVLLPPAERDPSAANGVFEWILIDLARATARPLLAAPASLYSDAAWSADSRFVALSPAFMPADSADAEGLAGRALVTVEVVDGKVEKDPVPLSSDALGYRPIRWTDYGILELSTSFGEYKPSVRLKHDGGKWELAPADTVNQKSVEVEIHQGLNEPPTLVARDIHTGQKRILLDFNPSLARRQATDGKSWSGALYRPVHYVAGERYPLVIQTHGFSRSEFAPDGLFTTAYAAQALANHDIAVLQLDGPDSETAATFTASLSHEVSRYVSGYEGAVRHFISEGLVDAQKVGILGFSRTGWYVEYMLTHSAVPLAAAIAADNIEVGYFEYVLCEDACRSQFDSSYGVAPFGEGLQEWIKQAPGFNVDKVHTPLRLEFDSGPIQGIVEHWEFFSHLRYLGKPVEFYVIPDIAHGVHQLQNPQQRLASQEGTVDWFCFWLKGEEDPDPAKSEQYSRWRKLRKENLN